MLSRYCSDMADQYEIKIDGVNKLVQTWVIRADMLFTTEIFNCICHYK